MQVYENQCSTTKDQQCTTVYDTTYEDKCQTEYVRLERGIGLDFKNAMLWPFCLLDLLIRICGGFQPVYNGGGGGVGGGHGGGHGGGGDGHIQPFIHGHNGLHRCVDTVGK